MKLILIRQVFVKTIFTMLNNLEATPVRTAILELVLTSLVNKTVNLKYKNWHSPF
jgi:hypothetical protein